MYGRWGKMGEMGEGGREGEGVGKRGLWEEGERKDGGENLAGRPGDESEASCQL